MGKIHRKYIEDFEALVRDFERLKERPSQQALDLVKQDVDQLRKDLEHIEI